MRYVLVQAFAMGVMFTYIAASPFIFQEHFNMSPLAYSLCFGANAIAIMLGSLTVSLFHDATDALRVGSIGFGIMSLFVAAALFFSHFRVAGGSIAVCFYALPGSNIAQFYNTCP